MFRVEAGENGAEFKGPLGKVLNLGFFLLDGGRAFDLRQQYLRAAKMDGIPYDSVRTWLKEVFITVEHHHQDLAQQRRRLNDPDLIYQPSSNLAKLMTATGTALVMGAVIGLSLKD